MKLYPLTFDGNADLVAVILAVIAVVLTLTLAVLRLHQISQETLTRDSVMFGLHLASAFLASGFILAHCYFVEQDDSFCKLMLAFIWCGWSFRRIFCCIIYYLRFKALIGAVYRPWWKYPALLPISCMVLLLCVTIGIHFGSREGGDCYISNYASVLFTVDTGIALGSVYVISSVGYLVLFIVPLLKYNDDHIGSQNKKHFLITITDIVVELLFLFLGYGGYLTRAVWMFWAGVVSQYIGLISTNILVIFVFANWSKYLCITSGNSVDVRHVREFEEQLLSPELSM